MGARVDLYTVLGIVLTVVLIEALAVALYFRMPVRHTRWFLLAEVCLLAFVTFHFHWLIGVLSALLGVASMAMLDEVLLRAGKVEKTKTVG
jgi:hypothetical protein